ncbi:cytochrome c oxidase copper chaperone-like [Drosophila obscura]|uniref:cytochrome c oxidase copper chaperone-like n=1 Tax=Drosophila obscura TaxID=7282 RepID=UPI001BB1CC55|nr:cytochrome c oxidase copper chaperone-like [Drosophila obscura]
MGNRVSKQFQTAPAAASEPIAAAPVAAESVSNAATAAGDKKTKCSACCACPETKQARDQCFLEHGEEHCLGVIDAYKKCMLEAGFNI